MKEGRRTLFFGTAFFALAAAALFISGSEWLDAHRELNLAQATIEGSRRQLDHDSPLGGEVKSLPESPSERDSWLIVRLARAAAEHRSLRVLSSRSEQMIRHKQLVELPTELVVEGEFSALVGFLDDLEAGDTHVRVRRAEFRRDSERNVVSLGCIASVIRRYRIQ